MIADPFAAATAALTGTNRHDSLQGSAADDTLEGGAGNDTLEGGGGRNTAVFSGNSADYRLGRTIEGLISVTDLNPDDGDDGTDLLHNIETLQFADRAVDGLLGGELRVSPAVEWSQGALQAVPLGEDGEFVIVSAVGSTMHAQRYDAEGRAIGNDVQLDTGDEIYLYYIQALSLPDGGFALSWQELNQQQLTWMQAYTPDGAASGERVLMSDEARPDFHLTLLADQSVVMTWNGAPGFCMQRIGLDGTPLGEPQVIAEEYPDLGGHAATAALADGGFVVTWQASWRQGHNYLVKSIRAQVYEADGTPRGETILVTAPDALASDYAQPAVCGLDDGGFAIAWIGGPTAESYLSIDLYSRSYDSDGTPRNDPSMVNQFPTADESISVTPLDDGGYLVAWRAMTDGMFYQPIVRHMDADGMPVADMRLLQTTIDFWGIESMGVATLPDGRIVTVWTSHTEDDLRVVRMQLLDEHGVPVAQVLSGTPSADRFDLGADGALNAAGGAGDDVYVVNEAGDRAVELANNGYDTVRSSVDWSLDTGLEDLVLIGTDALNGTGNRLANRIVGNEAANSIDGGDGDDTLTGGAGVDTLSYASANAGVTVSLARLTAQDTRGAGIDTASGFEHLSGSRFADALGGNALANIVLGDLGNDTLEGRGGDDTLEGGAGRNTAVFSGNSAGYRFGWEVDGQLRVTDIDPRDGDDGTDLLRDVHALQFDDRLIGIGGEGGLHMLNYRDQELLQYDQRVAVLADGGYVVAWVQGIDLEEANIFVQRFAADGVALGDPFLAYAQDYFYQLAVDVEPLAGGGFVLAWTRVYGIASTMLHVFDAEGRPVGEEFEAHASNFYDRVYPSIAATADGGFTVAWSRVFAGRNWDAAARRFDAEGKALGGEFRLNRSSSLDDGGSREGVTIAALSNGGMVGVWASEYQNGDYWGTWARVYGADGAPLGPEFQVSESSDGLHVALTVEALSDGCFVVCWVVDFDDLTGLGVFARIFAADGSALGGDFRVGSTILSEQLLPAIQSLQGGGFVMAWSSFDLNNEINTYVRVFDAEGKPLGPERQIEAPEGSLKLGPQIDALSDGGFIVTFNTITLEGRDTADLWSQRFDAQGTPLLAELRGGVGNDSIDLGGTGALQGAGGAGNDTYLVNEARDRVVELPGKGIDTVLAQIDWTLAPNVEVLRLASEAGYARATGSDGSNRLYGNEFNNVLEGMAGPDVIDGGAGADTASYAHAGAGVTVDLQIRDAQQTGGAGRDTLVRIERLEGSAYDDVLRGNAQANEIDGGAGADVLEGRAAADTLHGGGSDTLMGGTGDDYYFALTGDVVIELAEEGRDTVLAGGSFTLSADVENLYLMGKSAADGVGNDTANRLVGNDQRNVLDGRGGTDTLQGGAGDDTFLADRADRLIERSNEGYDSVHTAQSLTLGANIEELVLLGARELRGTGNELDNPLAGNGASNKLFGSLGADTLQGGGGADTLDGGFGADVLEGGAGADAFRFDRAPSQSSVDTIADLVHGIDRIELALNVFTDFAATGAIDAGRFVTGTAAADADDRLLYDPGTGALYYDADGSGPLAAQQFAQLGTATHPPLGADDFRIVA